MKSFFFCLFILCILDCKENDFFAEHWKYPIEEQGQAPSNFSPLESVLVPENCGTCHVGQYQGWKRSLHRDSAKEGLAWQLHGLGESKSEKCFSCHSPLKETSSLLKQKEGWLSNYPRSMALNFPQETTELGISCASCHVRKHVRYGPPQLKPNPDSMSKPHNSFFEESGFEDSRFCKKCHESPEDVTRISGRKMMETFSEWDESSFKARGVTCQNCHMPNREHAWKGIHDKEMVNSGISKSLDIVLKEDTYSIKASFKSVNIGHKFPTYAVPKVYLKLYALGKNGKILQLGDHVIGRLVDIQLTKEFYDTRLSPGEEFSIEVSVNKKDFINFTSVVFEANVEPDEMYIRMFRDNLENAEKLGHSSKVQKQIQLSLTEKEKTRYNLFSLRQAVPD